MQPYVLKLRFDEQKDDVIEIKVLENDRQQFSLESRNLLQKFLIPPIAELIGTTTLAFLSMMLSLPASNQQLTSALFEGATTFILMCIFGNVSGAHFNPAITLAVGFVGHCRFVIGAFMLFMQFLGSFIGGLLCRALIADAAFNSTFAYGIFGDEKRLFTNSTQAFFLEVVVTFLLCSAYLFEGVRKKGRAGLLCALIVGSTRSIVTYIGYRTIGHCANMALSFGYSISASIFLCSSKLWSLLYMPVFSNLIGAFCSAFCYCVVYKQAPPVLHDGHGIGVGSMKAF